MNEMVGFDLPEIEAFVAVARCGGFRDAASALGVAQSSLSQRIGRLEGKLHRRLFDRTTRSVALTTEGCNLMVYAEAMMGLAESARLHFEQPPRDGILKLGMVEDYVVGDLHRILSIFKRQYPRFAISIRTGLSTSLFAAVDDGRLDIVLAKQKPGRSRGRVLFTQQLEWAGETAALATDDGAIPLAVYPSPSATRTAILDTLRDTGRAWSVVTESSGLAGIVAALESGLAISAFSRRFVPAGVARLGDDPRLPALPALDYVIDQGPEPRDPAIDAFVAILTATIASGTGASAA